MQNLPFLEMTEHTLNQATKRLDYMGVTKIRSLEQQLDHAKVHGETSTKKKYREIGVIFWWLRGKPEPGLPL